MATVNNLLWGPAAIGTTGAPTAAITGFSLNDSDNSAAWTFCLPKDGTVTDVGFYATSINGSAPNYNVGLVTQDSSGRPTTTAYGGSAVTAYSPAGGAGWKWVTLSTPATAAAGDFVAVRIYPTASAPTGVNYMAVLATTYIATMSTGLQYTTSWAATAGVPPMAIKYNDGSVYGLALSSNTNHVQIRQNTTPDEVGAKFTVPAQMTCYGARFFTAAASLGSAATFDVVLYDSGGTALATCSVSDKDYVDDNNVVNVFFDAVTLAARTDYRITIKPGVTTNGDMYIPRYTLESTAAKAFFPDGANWQWTERTDAGAWTDTATDIPFMGLWVSDIDFTGGTVTTIFEGGPLSAEFPSTNFPALTPVNGRVALAFDASTDEACYWSFVAPQGGIGTTLTCIVYYAMASATSGAVYWQAALEAVTPGDSLDLDATTSFDTANSGNGTVPGTAGYMQAITVTMTNKDSIAAGDLCWLKLNRDADNASDTATGDALVYRVELRSA